MSTNSEPESNLPTAPANHPDPKLYFKFRRQTMVNTQRYMVLMTVVLVTAELFKPGVVSGLTAVITAFYTAFSVPTMGYYSNTAITEFIRK